MIRNLILYICIILFQFFSCNQNPEKKIETISKKITEVKSKNEDNPIVNYLRNAEIQYETFDQGENLINALNDALILPPDSLQIKRYEDYTGKKNQWDLFTIVQAHIVPENQVSIEQDFYKNIQLNSSKDEIKKLLEKLKEDQKANF